MSAGILQVGNGGIAGSLGTGFITGAGTVSFNRSDNVTLNNLIAGSGATILNLASASTLSLNNPGNALRFITFNGADGGIIDLLADIGLANAGGTNILATNSGTINATGGGRILLNGASDDTGAAPGKLLTINAVIANGTTNLFEVFQSAGSTGIVYLTANNTFTGTAAINGGILQVDRVGNQGVAAGPGAGSTISMNGTLTVGLKYVGIGETTDRIISLNGTTGGGTIDQSGTGLLRFTTNFALPGAGAKTLLLQGSTAGTGEIAGLIIDNSANVNRTAVTKAGTGIWTLSGANPYTGATTVTGGALILGNLLAVQNSVLTNSTVANSATSGIVFKSGLGGNFSIGGLAGSQNLALADDTNAALVSLTIGGATLTTGGTFSGVLSGTTDLTKTGPSTQTFTGLNTFTGKVIVTGGLVAVNAEAGLGANPGVATADQLTLNGGGLSAAANSAFTLDDANRGITIGAVGGTFDAQAGAVMTIARPIAGGANAVTKSGPGIVIFSQPNVYGTTTITGGTLVLLGAGTVGTGTVTLNGGALSSPAVGTAVTTGGTGGSLLYPQIGAGADVSPTLTLTAGSTLTVDVVNVAGTVTFASEFGSSTNAGLSKVGLGTLTLQGGAAGGNTFTGTTTAGAGNLALDFATVVAPGSGVNAAASPLSFRGGTLTLVGKSGTTDLQTFASTALLEGGSTLTSTQNTATSLGANLGLISRDGTTNKGTINFILPATGSYATTSGNNASGILGGWATVGGNSWATISGGNVAAYTADATTGQLPNASSVGTTNYVISGAATLTGSEAANALRFTTTGLTVALGTNNLTLGGSAGGLLTAVAAATISGTTTTTSTGFVNAGAAGELMVYANTGSTLTISAGVGGTVIAFGITKSGGGTLALTNGGTTPNNYTGVTTINGGILTIDAANRLGGSTGITLNGGALQESNTFTVGQALTLGLNGGSLNYTAGAGNGGWSSATAIAFLGLGSRTLTFNNNNAGRFATLSAAIGESGGPTSIVVNASSDTGLLQFSGANSSYTGATTINRGVLRLNAANAISAASNLIFNGGANRAILEFNATFGASFTRELGTLPGQVQWLGNGGFSSSNVLPFLVNLGGLATPATVTWGSGSFVPSGSTLQFAQNAANSNFGNGTINFQNPIDLAGAARTVEVLDNGIQSEAILSGLISGAAGSVLNKSGTGVLTLTADNTTSTNVVVNVAAGGGALVFANVNAIPGTTGATVTVNAGGSLVLTGSTNPLATIGSRIVATSAGAIALDTNSGAALDFSAFSNLSLGAYNPTIGQAVIFTGSITPFTDNVYRLGTGRSSVNTAAVTGNALINFTANAGSNILILPVTNQLADGGAARSLVVGSGATYLTSYHTFTGGTRVGQVTGQTGNANVGIGHDAALGAGLIQFSPTGTTAGTGFIGGINGDHILSNNVSVNVAGNWVSSGSLASDSLANSGALTYVGTTTLTGAVSIFPRVNSSIFLGSIAATGTITINGGTALFLTTPAGAVNKSYAQTTAITGGTLVIDSNNSLGSAANQLSLATAAAATLRIQPGTGSAITLTGRPVVFTATFTPTFDIPGGPVTATTSNLILPGVVSGGATTAQVNKIGLGTLTFQGLNTWSSTAANGLQIYGGTVLVDVATTATAKATTSITTFLALGTSANATAATFGGGGTFTINAGGNAATQTFTGLSAAAKDNAINLIATGGSAALTFNGATFNRSQQGGTLALTLTGTSSITLSGAVTSGAGTANQIVLDGNTTGNAFAVINGTDWAARNGTNNIVALGSAGAGTYTANTATVLAGNADMTAAVPTTTLAANTTVTSLRFNAAGAETVDLNASNLVTGGILVGTGAGAFSQTISASGAGRLQGIASRDLVLFNAAPVDTAVLTISAPIFDNTAATALTKSGPGTVVLGGANAFTGSIFLNGGVLSVASAGTAAAANPLGQAVSAAGNIFMNGGTLRYTGAGSTTTDRGATFNSFSTVEVTQAGGTLVETGAWVGIAGVAGLLNKTGPGTLSLSGTVDNGSLTVLVTAGTVNLDKVSGTGSRAVAGVTNDAAALVINGGTVRITGTGGDQIFNPSSVVVNGAGTFDFNGQSEAFDALAGTGTVTNTGANGVPITLTLGDATVAGGQANNGANTPNAAAAGVGATGLNFFSGSITDNGINKLAVTKAGPGTQIFSGTTKTYSGDTSVVSGVLRFGAANVLPSGAGKGNVILTGNTVIFGLTVAGILDIGGFNQALNGLTGSTGSIVTNTPPTSAAANQTNTLTVGLNDQTTQFDGIFQDGYVIQPGVTPVGRFGFVAVDKVGAGVLTLTGANTNTGTVTVVGGRIDLNNATGNALTTNVAINAGGTLKLLANNQLADANTVTTSGGIFDLNGKTETVGIVLTGGSILDGAGGGALSSNTAFDLQNGTVSAKLSGTSGLNKTNAGTVTLGGAQVHNFTGTTAVSAGTLVVASGASISASSAVNLTGTGRFFVNGSTAAAVPISVGGGATLGGSGTVNGTVSVGSGGIIEAGQSGSGILTVNTINFGGPATVNLFNLNTLTASILNVTTGLTTTAGAGNVVTINLTNSGSLDGITNYTANGYKLIDVPATFAFGAYNNFILGTVTGVGGRSTTALNFVDNDALYMTLAVVNPVWSGAQSSEWSTAIIAGLKNWYLPPSTITDYIDLPNPDTVIFNDTATGSTTVDVSVADVSPNGVTFNFGATHPNYVLQGTKSIIGTTNLVKSGTGTLTINNANLFTGGVQINGGVIKLGNANALGTGNTLAFGASAAAGTRLQLFGNNATVTGLSTNAVPGSPVVENGHGTTDSLLTVNLASGTNTFAGVLQDGAAAKLGLAKQGGGTLILTGANTATGGNAVSVGTLQIGSGGTAGLLAGDTSIAASATLDFDRSDASAYAGGVTGAGAVSVVGGGTLAITGNVAHSGGTNIATLTTLQIGNGGATGDLSGAGTITDNGTLAFNRTGSATVQAPIIGSGNLSVGNGVTVGTLILTGNNGYLGSTTINPNATLQVGNGAANGSLGTAANVTDNGTFAYGRNDAQTSAANFTGTGALRVLSGTLTLAGNNSYSNGTTVDAGAALIVGNVAGTAGVIAGFNATGTGNVIANGSVTFRRTGTNTFDNTISGGAAGNVTFAAGSWTFTNVTPYAGSTVIQSGATLNIAAGSGTGIGTGAIADAGALVFNRAVPYTLGAGNLVTGAGSVTLANSSPVIAAVDNQFNTTGVLNFGAAQGSAVASSLDLANFNSTFGSLNVQTNTTTANTITIAAGRTLTFTGGAAAVVTIGANSALGATTNLTFLGGGNLVVNRIGGTFQIGGATGTVNTGNETVNMSGLANFTADLGAAGLFRVGNLASTSATTLETLTGATNNTITAGTFGVGDNDGQGGGAAGAKTFNLGSGTNAINANTISIGEASTNRASGLVQFLGVGGTLTVRSATGATGVANLNLVNNASGTATQLDGKLLLLGHTADLSLNAIVMSARSAGTTQGSDATLSFDTGTLSANTLSMVARTGVAFTSGASSSTVNLGGGIATFGTVTMTTNTAGTAISTGAAVATINITGTGTTTITTLNMANDAVSAATATSPSTATVNIGVAGGTPTVALGTVTMAVNTSASGSATTATGNINIAAGTVTAAAISMANTANAANVSTAALSITGGSLTLAGNITTINGPGTENTSLTLNGGTLDLGGFSIGSLAGVVGSGTGAATFQSGTLRNLFEFNGGANLVKTTAGTLNLAGSNSYTGATTINAGTVNIDSLAAGATAQSLGTNTAANAVTLGVAGTSSGRLNYTGIGATLDKNITALGNGTDTVQNSGSGLLTLSGTLTKNGTTLTLNGGANGIAVTGAIVGANPNSDLTATNGTTTLSNDNSYKGATTVTSTGRLAVVTGGSLSGTTGVTVQSGGALLLNNNSNNIVNATTPAFLNVAGGTVALGTTVSADTTKTQTFGTLTLSGAATLDLGTGAQGNALVFAQAATFTSGTLQIWNWTQGAYTIGFNDGGTLNDTQDRFLFNGTGSGFTPGQLANIQFFSDGGTTPIGTGAGEVTFTGGQFEIVPVPEPATAALLGTVALCALLGCRTRRRAAHDRGE